MKFGALALCGTLLLPVAGMAQQTNACDILKQALAGNAAIASKTPVAAPASMAWPNGKMTTVGGGSYSAVLFEGIPSESDVKKMNQAVDAADKVVSQCLPAANRTVAKVGAVDREVRFCIAGNPRRVSISTSVGNRMISAHFAVEVPYTQTCPR